MKNLLEMNPDVKGDSHDQSPEDFMENQLDLLKTYSLIIVDQLSFVTQKTNKK